MASLLRPSSTRILASRRATSERKGRFFQTCLRHIHRLLQAIGFDFAEKWD